MKSTLRPNLAIRGVTLSEALVAIAVVGVLTAVAAPNVTKIGRNPLPDTANQVAGVLREARARAIAQTAAVRVRPLGRRINPATSVNTGGSNTQLEVAVADRTTMRCDSEDTRWTGISSSFTDGILKYGSGITQQVVTVDNTVQTVPTAWEICFNTRGMATVSSLSTNNFTGNNVVLTFQEGTNTSKQRRIEIFPAGGVQVYDN